MAKKKKHEPRPEPQELGLPRTGVETHAHLDLEHFEEDLDAVLERARASGLAHIGQVFMGPRAYHEKRALFAPHGDVFFLLGVHPHDASGCDDATLEAMRQAFLADPRLRALGEMGLDFYWMHSTQEEQERVFRQQLELTLELDTRAVIHSRDAEARTVEILDEMGFAGRPLLWHCFGRDADFASELLARGWHLSIPGPVTFPRSEELREAVAMIPLDRLVLETDCPYLTPAPYRGQRNEPAYVVFTARTVAQVKGLEVSELWTRCGETAKAFFGLE